MRREVLRVLAGVSGQGRMLTIPKLFIDATGSIEAALLLSQALYWFDVQAQQGVVKKTDAEIHAETGLHPKTVQRLRPILARFGITREMRGVPATGHYTLDLDKFLAAFDQNTTALEVPPDSHPDWTHRPVQSGQSVQTCVDKPTSTSVDILSTQLPIKDLKEEKERSEAIPGHTQLPHFYQKTAWHESLEAETAVQAAAPGLMPRLTELRRHSGRTEGIFRAWLREFVQPHIERLGPAFEPALADALRVGILSNPSWALKDVAKSLEGAVRPANAVQAATGPDIDSMFEDVLAQVERGQAS